MDITIVFSVIGVLLTNIFGFTDAQDCISAQQVGHSVINKPSQLECMFGSDVTDPFFLQWIAPGSIVVASVIFSSGDGTPNDLDPDRIECDWIQIEQKSVLVIKSISFADDGDWQCYLKVRSGLCREETRNHYLEVIGK